MDNIIKILCQLQDIDLQYESFASQLKSSPQSILDLEAKIASLEAQQANAENLIKTFEKKQRTYESDIRDNEAHIKRSREKTKSIKSNKEYQALLKEIEDTEKKNAVLEEEVIKCLYEMESSSGALTTEKEKLKDLQKRLNKEKKTYEVQRKDIEQRFSALETERKSLADQVPKNVLSRYTFLRKVGQGVAVGFVEKGTCSACHTNIPAQYVIELRKTQDIQYCLTCQRFLTWRDEEL
ncbi:MAG: hypothetical protein HQK75_15060 [Candidatus Magnetomorum sp.]|nr:hypothetical protein [Candidatus Magnetomorum sp.]